MIRFFTSSQAKASGRYRRTAVSTAPQTMKDALDRSWIPPPDAMTDQSALTGA